MGFVIERYSSAINSSNLRVDYRTRLSDTDVLAAMGWADKSLTSGKDRNERRSVEAPLAVPLQRLFCGDKKAATVIVQILADMAWKKARAGKVKIDHSQALDLARQCLAWHRDGICGACYGRGYDKIPGTNTLSSHSCKECDGAGKMPFEKMIHKNHRELGRWLLSEIEISMCRAGPAAMQFIASSMDL